MGGLNPRPPPCKGGALPTELIPQADMSLYGNGANLIGRQAFGEGYGLTEMGLGRIELPTSRLSGVRSNRTELQARNPPEL